MEENLIEEKSEKSQFLERLSICLRIIAIVSLIIGVYLLVMNPQHKLTPNINQPRNANYYRQHGFN